MGKTKKLIIVIMVLVVGIMPLLIGCGGIAEKSKITVNNLPPNTRAMGYVFSTAKIPETQTEYNYLSDYQVAIGTRKPEVSSSSITLVWYSKIYSGSRLIEVVVGPTNISKITVANVSISGNVTVDWNSMTDVSSLPDE